MTSHCRVAAMTALYNGLRYAAKMLAVTERLLNQNDEDRIHDYGGLEAHAQ